jgi:hypothetical protein
MNRLRRVRLDLPSPEAAPRTLIRQQQPDRPGAHDQHIEISWHDPPPHSS